MKPLFQVIANDTDITNKLVDRLISLTVIDERGLQSDSVEIRLDDRDSALALLTTGAELQISLGYEDQGAKRSLYPMGLYTVDEIGLEGPPDTYVIRAKAADMRESLKQQKTRAWDDTTLGDIVAAIAAEHGLQPRVSNTLGAVAVPHLSQTEESDVHLLTRLAKDHDAVAKPADGRLLFVPKGQARSASGKEIKPISIHKTQCSRWRVVLADRSKYQAVIAHWNNTRTGVRTPEKAGSGKPVYTLRGTRRTQAAAQEAAMAKLGALKRGAGTGNITIKGGALNVMAETPLQLSGWRDGIDNTWITMRAEHRLDNGGLNTLLDIEAPKR